MSDVTAPISAAARGRAFGSQLIGSRVAFALLHTRTGRIGALLAGFAILVALIGPFVAPYSPTEVMGPPYQGPSPGHLLGLDVLGRDVLSRVLHGGVALLAVALLATLLAYAVGIVTGLFLGYTRGAADTGITALIDVIVAVPPIILVLLLVAGLGSSIPLIIIAIASLHAPRVARIVRAITIETAVNPYVEAAVLRGERRWFLLSRELLPNMWTPILADFGIRVAGSIILFASLSYLGFGLTPPAADWGMMISENRLGMFTQPWVVVVPASLIAILTVGISLGADAIARSVGVGSIQGRA
jgi:peptide/nickel transport system permease protein